ncbi:MAG: branched-chain amino acid transaminase [Acidobacteriota bacterium]
MNKRAEAIWHNGSLVPWENATCHIMTHGLHYGTSVFEGIRAYETHQGTCIFRLRDHLLRLFASARIYRLDIPWSFDEVFDACRDVVTANDLGAAYVRPIAYLGAGGIGLTGRGCEVELAIAAFPWGAYLGEESHAHGIDVGFSSWQRPPSNATPLMAKAGGHYLSSRLVSQEAQRHGYTEGIALNTAGFVSEGAGENLFLVIGGELVTPPLAASVLSGITRATVFRLAAEIGIPVREENLIRERVYGADEMFLTGTAAEIVPVRTVDGLDIGDGRPGPITRKLQEMFRGIFDGTTEDRWGWLDPVAAAAEA